MKAQQRWPGKRECPFLISMMKSESVRNYNSIHNPDNPPDSNGESRSDRCVRIPDFSNPAGISEVTDFSDIQNLMDFPERGNFLLIGGSPCAGKTTYSENLSEKTGIRVFHIDDHLGEYAEKGRESGLPFCLQQHRLSPEEFWMRDPQEMCTELIGFYREIFPFVMQDIRQIAEEGPLIAEGIALMPDLVMPYIRDKVRTKTDTEPDESFDQDISTADYWLSQASYLCMTAEEKFQILHYQERPWVPLLLEGCQDKEAAFANWMKRDALFAAYVTRMAKTNGCRLWTATQEEIK